MFFFARKQKFPPQGLHFRPRAQRARGRKWGPVGGNFCFRAEKTFMPNSTVQKLHLYMSIYPRSWINGFWKMLFRTNQSKKHFPENVFRTGRSKKAFSKNHLSTIVDKCLCINDYFFKGINFTSCPLLIGKNSTSIYFPKSDLKV